MENDRPVFRKWIGAVKDWFNSSERAGEVLSPDVKDLLDLIVIPLGEILRHNPELTDQQKNSIAAFLDFHFQVKNPSPFLRRLDECRMLSPLPMLRVSCVQLRLQLPLAVRLSLIDFFSGCISPHALRTTHQLYLLRRIAGYLGLSSAESDRIMHKARMLISPYAVLGVPEGANLTICKSAYRARLRKEHPDRFPEPLKAEQELKFRHVQWAWEAIQKLQSAE